MQEVERSIMELAAAGAAIGVAKMLVSGEELSFRVILGRAILGSATSMLAGVMLMQFPAMPPLALLAVGSGLGIVGQQYIEKWIIRKAKKTVEDWAED